MTKKLFTGTTNGLELWVDVQALEKLRQEQEDRLRKLRERAGGRKLTGIPIRSVDKAIQVMLDKLKIVGDCWVWTGATMPKGYGVLSFGGKYGKVRCIHSFIFFLTENQIPPMVCHHCDNPSCGRPSHLFAGNGRINCDDKIRKGRAKSAIGEQAGASKLTDEKVLEIRRRYQSWAHTHNTGTRLAEQFGVSPSTIYQVLRGESWKHVQFRRTEKGCDLVSIECAKKTNE